MGACVHCTELHVHDVPGIDDIIYEWSIPHSIQYTRSVKTLGPVVVTASVYWLPWATMGPPRWTLVTVLLLFIHVSRPQSVTSKLSRIAIVTKYHKLNTTRFMLWDKLRWEWEAVAATQTQCSLAASAELWQPSSHQPSHSSMVKETHKCSKCTVYRIVHLSSC